MMESALKHVFLFVLLSFCMFFSFKFCGVLLFVILFVFVWLSSIVAVVFLFVVRYYMLTIMLAGMPVCSMAGVRFRVVGWLVGGLVGGLEQLFAFLLLFWFFDLFSSE